MISASNKLSVFMDILMVDFYSDNMYDALLCILEHVSTNTQDQHLHEYIQ